MADSEAEEALSRPGLADIHSHLFPGVDDGAQTVAESRSALRALWDEGVRRLVTTPHIDGSLAARPAALAERLARLDAAWERLRKLAASEFPRLEVGRGTEVMLDTPEPDLSDARLRLGGGRFVLVEFPHLSVPPQSGRAIEWIRGAGFVPVIAHAERYSGLDPELRRAQDWRWAGAYLQGNAASLLGRYGNEARAMAFRLLERGLADYLASDFHARGRPYLAAAHGLLRQRDGSEQAALLLTVNPRRLLADQSPLPVPELPRPSGFWRRMREMVFP